MSIAPHHEPLAAFGTSASLPLLATAPPTPQQRRLALSIVVVSAALFLAVAPFAQVPLAPVAAFLPIYQTAVVVGDIITFVLLLGQYDILRRRDLFVIACGYLFNATMAGLHTLSFPGLFAPSGWPPGGAQTTAWLYFLWHAAFPLFVVAYVALRRVPAGVDRPRVSLPRVALAAIAVVAVLAAAFLWLALRADGLLPPLMNGAVDGAAKFHVALAVWALCFLALALLWWRKPHSLLDMWLMVILCVWIFDVALAAVLNQGRFDIGWYTGRIYGLIAATGVLIAMLLENDKLYLRLASAIARERAYLKHLHDPVVTIDTRGAIRNANPALERVLGYSIGELLGRNVALLMAEPERSSHDAHLRRYLETREPHIIGTQREVVGLHKNGERIPLALTVSEFSHDDETLFIGTLRDLRDHNRLIAELTQARDDAEQANRAKSAFLATMSHEIRTPMNGVLGMIEVLSHTRLTEHQQDLVKTIRESAGTLLALIDNILDFSKIEAGRLVLERQPLVLRDLLEGLASSLVSVAVGKQVYLDLFVAPGLPGQILGDDVRLRQIIYNLVGNAIKFSAGRADSRGRVYLRVEARSDSPLVLSFSVSDNGIGITPEALQRLFTPFTQAEVATTRLYGGTGLGLAICQRLASLMGGRIDIASEPGKGSTFELILPCEPAPEQPAPRPPSLAGTRCRIVDSDLFHAADLHAYLADAGACVRREASAEAVLQDPDDATPVVVIQGAQRDEFSTEALHTAFAAAPWARHLIIMRGRRQRARVQSTDVVIVDGDALRRDVLLRAVAVTAGLATPEPVLDMAAPEPLAVRAAPGIAAARAAGQLILVAEDDPVNQKVILQQLALLGYTAEVAANGELALDLWRRHPYALLLTDLHMPAMDGYTLATKIRDEEDDERRMPIFALTANALQGEAERARSCGMDGYLTKPVKLDQLRAVLAQWIAAAPAAAPPPSPRAGDPAESTAEIDISVLKSLIGDDEDIVRDFLGHYASTASDALAAFGEAREHGDRKQIGALAHKLKSSSRSVGALALGDLCADLECAVAAEDQAAITRLCARVETSIAEVRARIERRLAANTG